MITSKYMLNPTHPKTTNPNAVAPKGATKVERNEPPISEVASLLELGLEE